MNESANNKSSDAAQHENGNILVSDNGVGQADKHAEKEANHPPRPARQLHASNDEANREAASERAQQSCFLVGKRHRQHQGDIYCAEHQSRDQTKNDFRHARF